MRKFFFISIIFICVIGLLLIFADLFSGKKATPVVTNQISIPFETQDTAQKALDLVLKLDFDSLQNYFSESMKSNYSTDKFKNLWLGFFNTVGPYQKLLRTQNEKDGINDRFVFVCRFQRRVAFIKMTLNPSREIEKLEASLNY